jgi:hypothetical protein
MDIMGDGAIKGVNAHAQRIRGNSTIVVSLNDFQHPPYWREK